MGCGTCSTTKDNGTPAGCKSNGTCGTSGCNQLNVYNWLADMQLPEGHKPFDICEVRFKGSRKEFFRNVNDIPLQVGGMVAVEGTPGHDIGEVSMVGELVRFQMKKKGITEGSTEVKMLYREARTSDLEKYKEVKAREHATMHRSRTIALHLNLRMKLSDVEFQGDGKKATFFYTADDRVDFRELIKKLADEFKIRVEMKQIGMRQEASRLGGIGSCGRELCCSTWLTDFKIVSTSAARYQNLSLNPLKLAGQCGKLKCCLNYELDSYIDAVRDIPDSSVKLLAEKTIGSHRKTDIFKRLMWFAFEEENTEKREGWGNADSWVPLTVDRVKEIIELNKQNIRPSDVGHVVLEHKAKPLFDFKDTVGEDSLTRMDHLKKKKKKKKKGNQLENNQNTGNKPSGNQPVNIPSPQRQNNPPAQKQNNPPSQKQNSPQPVKQNNPRPPRQNNPAPVQQIPVANPPANKPASAAPAPPLLPDNGAPKRQRIIPPKED